MKFIISFFLFSISLSSFGQDKYNYIDFNRLTEVKGTPYVIASIYNRGKMAETKSKYLLFINTLNSEQTRVEFPSEGKISQVKQVKMDSLAINCILVLAQTVDLDLKGGIDWSDPKQLFMLSPNGKEKVQISDDDFFISTFATNEQTGTIIITGHYDTNKNGKHDKNDKNSILIYDLKSKKVVSKV